jgi:uncharacterized protein YgiM (DUF1202 family)
MKLIKYLTLIVIAGMATFSLAAERSNKIIGTINAANLNIRVKPNTKFSAVARLKYGDKVEIVRQTGDWYEIVAPKNSTVWVSASFIKAGHTTRKVNVRPGPGINYQAYGTIPAQQPVTILSDLSSEWTKIAPTPGLTAWAFAKYVKLTPAALEQLNAPATPLVTKPKEKTTPHQTVKLQFIAGFAKQVEYNGTIWKLDEQGKYATHALVEISNGKAKPLCFLRIEGKDINRWNNKLVKIAGIKKLVNGWKLPIVIVKAADIVEKKINDTNKIAPRSRTDAS